MNIKLIKLTLTFLILLSSFLITTGAEDFGYNYLEAKEDNITEIVANISSNNSVYWDGNAWSATRWVDVDGGNANSDFNIVNSNIRTTGTGRFDGGIIDSGSQQVIKTNVENQLIGGTDTSTEGSIVFDWGVGILNDDGETISIHTSNRILHDSNPLMSIDWDNRIMYDAAEDLSINYNSRIMYDNPGIKSIDWSDRSLWAEDGTNQTLTWKTANKADFINNLIETGGDIRIDTDVGRFQSGNNILDYTWGWDGTNANHTITAGSFQFNGGDMILNGDDKFYLGSSQDFSMKGNSTAMYFSNEVGDIPFLFDNDIRTTAQFLAKKGAYNDLSYAFFGDEDTGIFSPSGGVISFVSNSGTSVQIRPNGVIKAKNWNVVNTNDDLRITGAQAVAQTMPSLAVGNEQNLSGTTQPLFELHNDNIYDATDLISSVDASGNLYTKGNANITGNLTGNFYYAEIWGHDPGEVGVASSGVYYNVSNITNSKLNGFTYNNDNQITSQISGLLSINSHYAFSGGANTEYHLAFFVNNIQAQNCHTERVVGTGADVGSASITCLCPIEAGDIMNIRIENVDNTVNPNIHDINLNIIRIAN